MKQTKRGHNLPAEHGVAGTPPRTAHPPTLRFAAGRSALLLGHCSRARKCPPHAIRAAAAAAAAVAAAAVAAV